ncbi:MAG: hypothetical protein JF616_04870 [Fibrobacteres bacterium]|nr:hypothetical protein [Fibrobacterota bacterium]
MEPDSVPDSVPDPIQKHDTDLAAHLAPGNMQFAQVAGLVSCLAMAVLWGLITYAGNLVIGYFAIAVGLAVGASVRFVGKGSGTAYAVTAGAYALLGCMLGNLMCIAFAIAHQSGYSLAKILFVVDYGQLFGIYLNDFDVHDIIFYAIAFSSAFKIALNPMSKDELDYVLEAKGITVQPRKSRRR